MDQQRVEIHAYDPDWVREFEEIGDSLRAALGETAVRIDHIGSTAVPGLAAKPIIDVQVSVLALEPMNYVESLRAIGYERREQNPETTDIHAATTTGMRIFSTRTGWRGESRSGVS